MLAVKPVMWLSDQSGISNNGSGGASTWGDFSGNNNGLGQVSSLFDPAITSPGQNGRRTLTFDNSVPDVLGGLNAAFGTNNIPRNVGALTIFVAGNPTKNPGSIQRLFYFSASNNGNARGGLYLQTNSVYAFQRRLDTDASANANIVQPDSNWHLYSSEHNWIGQTVAVRIDGGTAVTTTTTQGSANTPDTASSEVCLMGSSSTSGQYASGMIGELIVLNYIPTDADRQRIEGYSEWHWGTQGNLAADHPYKNGPPMKS